MDDRRKRIRFRAWRRGFREIDLILGAFADAHVEELDEAGLAEFERLLDTPDQDVYDWIVGRTKPPTDQDGPVLGLIRSFRFFARTAAAGRSEPA
jgi:antitoxin CptB